MEEVKKNHPWRFCSPGRHWVKTHPLHIPPSNKNPGGSETTRKILGNEKGELKDHYLTLTKKNLNDPNINIAAGIRWLFQKKKLAEGQLGRSVTWIEAVAKYKSVLKDYINSTPKGKKNMGPFLKYLEELKSCKKT